MGDYIQAQDGSIIRDFMSRTLHNLEFIESLVLDHNSTPNVYEVTQLINSMLGLVIFPRETFWQHFSIKHLNELPACFPTLVAQAGRVRLNSNEKTEFQALIRMIRNSFAHFGVKVNAETGEIDEIQLTNKKTNKKNEEIITWQMEISVSELREFVKWFASGIVDSSLLDIPINEIKVV